MTTRPSTTPPPTSTSAPSRIIPGRSNAFERAVAAATLATGSTTLGRLRALQHLARPDHHDDDARRQLLTATRRTLTDLAAAGQLPPELATTPVATVAAARRLLATAWQHASDRSRAEVAA
jgi:hypothetical protein